MRKYFELGLGLLLTALGISLVIKANLGAFPVTAMNMGFANVTGFSYGTASMIVELIILVINIKNKEKIGLATICNSILGGYLIDMWNLLLPQSNSIFIGIPLLVLGMIVLSFGFYFITKAGLGNAASNGLMMVLVRKTGKSVSMIRTIEEILFMVIGFVLGGKVGLATVLLSLGFGTVMGSIYKALKFDPDKVQHKYLEIKKSNKLKIHELEIIDKTVNI